MSYYLDQLMEEQRKKQMLADLLSQAQNSDARDLGQYSMPTTGNQAQVRNSDFSDFIRQGQEADAINMAAQAQINPSQSDVRNSDNTIASLLAQQQMYAQQPNQDARDLGAMAQGPYRGESMAANTPPPQGPQAATGYLGDARDFQAQQGLQDAMNAVPLQSQAPTDLNANLSDKRIKVSLTNGPDQQQGIQYDAEGNPIGPDGKSIKNYAINNRTGALMNFDASAKRASDADAAFREKLAAQGIPKDHSLGEKVKYFDPMLGEQTGWAISKYDSSRIITKDGRIIDTRPVDWQETKRRTDLAKANAEIAHAQSQQKIAEFNAVNGQTPAGFRRVASGDLERIPGGPPDEKHLMLEQKKQLEMANDAARIKESQGALELLKGSTDDLLKNQNLSRITGLQGVVPNIPGLAGADAKAALESLKNKVALGAISTLKSLSANGATGLGAISNFEQKMLQQSLQSLEGSQSEEQLRKNLTFISDWTDKKNAELTDAFNSRYAGRTQNGAMSKDKAGRPIVNINGKWVYAS